MRRIATHCVVLAGLLALSMAPAQAVPVVVGPGTTFTGAGDTANQTRINVERDSVNFAAGTYQVVDFSFNGVALSGFVRPFLAELTSSSPRGYEVVWLGPDYTNVTAGLNSVTYTPASQLLTLSSATDLYAGFYISNGLVQANTTIGATDHDNSPVLPSGVGFAVNAFSHENNPRTYGFQFTLDNFVPPTLPVVPEPSTLALGVVMLAFGLSGHWLRRRRALG